MYLSSFEECMLLAFIHQPIFLFPVFCLKLLITKNSRYLEPFLISLEGSSYQEPTVHVSIPCEKYLISFIEKDLNRGVPS